MGLFNGLTGLFKPMIVKEIHDGTWGHLVTAHGLTVDTLSKDIRCRETRHDRWFPGYPPSHILVK